MRRILIALTLLGTLVLSETLLAQGYMVRPMRMEFSARPGQKGVLPFEVRQTDPDAEGVSLEVQLHHLGQTPGGSWRTVPAEEPAPEQTCRPWLTLSTNRVQLAPMAGTTLEVPIEIPLAARGSYSAALTFQTRRETAGTFAMNFRFVVPVIVHVQGRAVRQDVQARSLELEYQSDPEGGPGHTAAIFSVANEGLTYVRVVPQIAVRAEIEGRDVLIAELDAREVGILPATTLDLAFAVPRPLPAGTYRLEGNLTVDGRRIRPFSATQEFAGDPRAKVLRAGAGLLVDPLEVTIAAAPGATRTATVQVTNNATDPIEVTATPGLPDALSGVIRGERLGTDFSAAGWIRVAPPRTVIPGNSTRPVRLVASLPRSSELLPEYYADLLVQATYRDGSPAGQAGALVVLDSGIASDPAAQVADVRLSSGGAGTAIVSASLVNTSDIRYEPTCRLVLLNDRGEEVDRQLLEGDPGPLLPLGRRRYSAMVDLGRYAAGNYTMRIVCQHGASTSRHDVLLRITEQGGAKAAELI